MDGYEQKSSSKVEEVGKMGGGRRLEMVLRLVALLTTVVAVIVMGFSKETKQVSLTIIPGLPPLPLSAVAKPQYSSAIVFFIVANSIASAYVTVSLFLSLANRPKRRALLHTTLMMLDLIILVLLTAAIGAALAVGVLAAKGNSHMLWHKACGVFGRYCRQVGASISVSFIGMLVFLMLVVLSILNLLHM